MIHKFYFIIEKKKSLAGQDDTSPSWTLSYLVGTGAEWETMLHVIAAILRMPRDLR